MRKALALLLACYLFLSSASANELIQVRTELLENIASYPERSAPATVVSLNAAIISAEISARVIELPARVGDVVEAGTRLAGLDCTDYELAERRLLAGFDSLDARIDLAGKRLERTRLLRLQDSVAAEALDERISELAILEAEYRSAQVALDIARVNMARCHISSPFNALVTERSSAVGQYAVAGTPLIRILDINNIEISAQATTSDINQIESATRIYFTYSDGRYPVRIRAILPVINPETRNQEVRLLFNDTNAITGAAGKLIWFDPRPHIPASLLVQRHNQLGIFIHRNGSAEFHPVPGAQSGRSTPVNLPGNTELVIEGHYSLQDKVQVQVIN